MGVLKNIFENNKLLNFEFNIFSNNCKR